MSINNTTFTPIPPSSELAVGLSNLTNRDFKQAQIHLSSCPEITTNPEVCYRLGVAQAHDEELENNLDQAISTWKQTLRLDATFAPALYDMALAYVKLDKAPQAVTTFSRLINSHPDHAEGRFNFGNLLYRMGQINDAIAMYAPLTDQPNPPRGILVNLGRALRRAGRLIEADACYQKALLSNQEDHFTQWNRSHVLCLLGRWEEGFTAWEHRLKATVKLPLTPEFTEWTGGSLPESLLIIAEQGHGDAIQCLRYIPYIIERGCKPILALHPAVVPFAKELMPSVQCIDFSMAEKQKADAWVPLFSLPHRLELPDPSDTLPPSCNPAFANTISDIAKHTSKPKHGLNIGLVWAGNPGHDNDHIRSIPLPTFFPLMEQQKDINWHSLQVGKTDDTTNITPSVALAPMPNVNSFAETAHYAAQMDLIICVDTAIAHIAGTLGIPTWLLLAAEPDWRWGQTGASTPWYPSVRLFRQTELGNWDIVFHDLNDALQQLY